MELTLSKMVIDNFKGIEHLELPIYPATTHIFGRNGSGKTTIADAYTWVLLGKDAAGNAPGSDDFREKPLDENGEERHMLTTSVQLFCKLDGEPFNLRRTQEENWVRQRGKQEQKYMGNVSKYYVNDVPVKQTEFTDRIAEIADADTFRFMTILGAFNGAPWQDKRHALLNMSSVDIDGVLMSRPEYSEIAHESATKGVTIEQLKKLLKDAVRELNTQLKLFPARIDEATRAIPTIPDAELAAAEKDLEELPYMLDKLSQEITDVQTTSAAAVRDSKIRTLTAELAALKNEMMTANYGRVSELQRVVESDKMQIHLTQRSIENYKEEAARLEERAAIWAENQETIRSKYRATREEQPDPSEDFTTCPTCGQPYPPEKRNELITAYREQFEAQKAARIAAIVKEGKELGESIQDAKDAAAAALKEATAKEETLKKMQANLAAHTADLEKANVAPDFSANPRIAELESEIASLSAVKDEEPAIDIMALQQQRQDLEKRYDAARAVMVRRDTGKEAEKRVRELHKQQQDAGAMMARYENLVVDCEGYTKARCALLEESINNLFPSVRWKLFNNQINGGIADCCMCMIPCNGVLVPYDTANTAAQIHADAEIVGVISDHAGATLPLFLDGAERVNVLPPHKGQLIILGVTFDNQIKVEGA